MKQETTYLTQEKFNELTKELEFLKTVRRNEIAQELEYAKALGDLSENAEYHEARETQAEVEDRIAKVENLLKTVSIVSVHSKDKVTIGSLVRVKKAGTKGEQVYTIVSSEEADLAKNKISFNSPLGHALVGKKKADKFSFKTPKGEVEYTIVGIE
jgi:transcription elongation factor GreA